MLKINKYINQKSLIIDKRLKQLIPIQTCQHEKLYKAANYALHSGGKRLRPILVLATVETFQKNFSIALDIACAIELIHTYSLIHDDLPCMDNDDLRRNKPSLHKKYNEWISLLTGNYLLTKAFEIITTSNLSDEQKTQITNTLAKRTNNLIFGQYVDLSNQKDTWETVKSIYLNKTANLIIACLECGGIIAKAKKEELLALKNFGKDIGLAYQIVDDILDEPSETNAISMLGLQQAKEKVKHLYDNGILHLAALSFSPPLLKDLAYKLIHRNR